MLTIEIEGEESFDEKTQQFLYDDSTVVLFEHSLASISKWESIWKKPFLGKEEKTTEETLSYIHLMCISPGVSSETLFKLTEDHYKLINDYIGSEMTATWFGETPDKNPSQEVITAEIVYHWMFTLKLPLECENWHFNRLTTLIKVMNLKNQPKKKMSQHEVMARQRSLNAKRRAEMGNA